MACLPSKALREGAAFPNAGQGGEEAEETGGWGCCGDSAGTADSKVAFSHGLSGLWGPPWTLLSLSRMAWMSTNSFQLQVCFGSEAGAAVLRFGELGEWSWVGEQWRLLQLCPGPWALKGPQSFLPLQQPFRGGAAN